MVERRQHAALGEKRRVVEATGVGPLLGHMRGDGPSAADGIERQLAH